MDLRDLETFGKPGAVVYLADCIDLMRLMPAGSVDAVFADPPYRLSNGGVTVKNGRVDSVDKGTWDRSLGSFERDHEFNERWLTEARRVLKPGGTIWVSGTHHVIFSIGFALQTLGFRIINPVAWEKPDPPPNALHTAFTHPKAVAATRDDAPAARSWRQPGVCYKGARARGKGKEMSLTPIPPERCGHVAPMVVESREGGYAARCLRCGSVGPVGASSAEARRALLELGRSSRRR
jgi:hypothetical protein